MDMETNHGVLAVQLWRASLSPCLAHHQQMALPSLADPFPSYPPGGENQRTIRE